VEAIRPVIGVKRSLGFTEGGSVMKKSRVDEVLEKMSSDWMQRDVCVNPEGSNDSDSEIGGH
jgi:hypothetical protein